MTKTKTQTEKELTFIERERECFGCETENERSRRFLCVSKKSKGGECDTDGSNFIERKRETELFWIWLTTNREPMDSVVGTAKFFFVFLFRSVFAWIQSKESDKRKQKHKSD